MPTNWTKKRCARSSPTVRLHMMTASCPTISPSAKRHLKKLRKRQARFQKDTNHRISKDLVVRAKGTARGIALEDLSDIRERTRLRKAQRARHSNWGFAQLRQFISYKAALAGVLVYIIDPAYTSQRCSACGHTERGNRPTQSHFCCLSCGHTTSADTNAAIHISRAAVIPPIVSETALPSRQGQAAALESVRYMTTKRRKERGGVRSYMCRPILCRCVVGCHMGCRRMR